MEFLWFTLAAILIFAGIALPGWLTRRRRARVAEQPLPDHWEEILEQSVPVYRQVPADLRERYHDLIQNFLAEKSFEACGGLEEVSDPMRVTIAAYACLLLLGGKGDLYPKLRSILVYPSAYRGGMPSRLFSDDPDEEDFAQSVRYGESWGQGSVVLSWRAVERSLRHKRDAFNVVLHEFAHQLDQDDGDADGVPELASRGDYAEWAEVMGESYDEFCDEVEAGKRTLIDDYGAEGPEEYFAVATEAFFEKSGQLRDEQPRLYDLLKRYYGLDPAAW